MYKLAATYGTVCGLFLMLLFYASMLVNIDPFINIVHLFFDALLIGVFIFVASLDFKRRIKDRIFHFWQGMTIGFVVYLMATLIFIIGLSLIIYFKEDTVINYQTAATKFLEERKDIYLEEFGVSGYKSQIDAIKTTTGFDLVKSMSFKKLITGFLITPVISIILRKKPN